MRLSIHDDHQEMQPRNFTPSLIIEGVPVTYSLDEWAGVLNIPCSMGCKQIEFSGRTAD